MSLNTFVDAAVDKAAKVAKVKVKSMLGGGGADAKQPNKSGGGIGGLFPSAGDASKGDGGKSKGGLFGGLLASPNDNMNQAGGAPGGAAGGAAGVAAGGVAGGAGGDAGNADFNAAVDELAGF